jgi:hypothetical protein
MLLLPHIAEQDGRGIHIVDRNVEEALHLICVQIDSQHAIHARARDHVRDQLRGDRHTHRARAAILACVTKVRNHCRNPRGRGAATCIDHDEQFHQVIVRRGRGRLYDEYIASANVLEQLNGRLRVAEPADCHTAQRHH